MSVASHLAVSPAQYDARIRSLIPLYDELIAEVARALGHAARPVRFVVDLDLWLAHFGKTFGSRARGRRVYESWPMRTCTCRSPKRSTC